MDYFSQNYAEARKKFLNETKHLKTENILIRDDLYIDTAFYNSRKKNKIIFIISGTHGVEGYIGSAAQLLFIKEYLPKIKNTSICLIHALNPYGFKHDRRVNENNIDLNRNSIYDERLMLKIPNTSFSNAIADSLLFLKLNRPRKHRIIETAKYYTIVLKTIMKTGIKNTIHLGISGQSTYPTGLGYKGIKLEDSLLHLRTIIEEKTQGYKEAIFIDIHSGIGKKFTLQGFTNKNPDSQEFSRIKKILKKIKSRNKTKTTNHTGSISDLFLARSHAKNNTDITIEYGTVPKMTEKLVLNYLGKLNIEENQVFYFGNQKKREKTRKKYKKAYSPTDKTFKKFFTRKTKKFYEKIIQEIEKK